MDEKPASPGNPEMLKMIKEVFPELGDLPLTYLCLVFDWEKNVVRCHTEILIGEKRVYRLLELMKNGSWKETQL